MKRIYVIESLCNGCRLCETFCSSLTGGVFGATQSRINVVRTSGESGAPPDEIPVVNCSGLCVRPIYGDGQPTCVAVCPTGALIYEEAGDAAARRAELERARQTHSLFKVVAPWKWPFPWSGRQRPMDGD